MFRLAVGIVAALIAVPAAAVVVTSLPGASDPGAGAGQKLLVSFDAPAVAGITSISHGAVITAAGNIGGVRAAPAGAPAGGIYQSIGTGGSTTFDFSKFTRGHPLANFSLYWGSIYSANRIDFLTAAGAVVFTVLGSEFPAFNGGQTQSVTNRRVSFDLSPGDNVTKVKFSSGCNAFEFDSIQGSMPEPGAWAMLIVGFGVVGHAARRRRDVLATA
jgi:hypothetical protein